MKPGSQCECGDPATTESGRCRACHWFEEAYRQRQDKDAWRRYAQSLFRKLQELKRSR